MLLSVFMIIIKDANGNERELHLKEALNVCLMIKRRWKISLRL